MNPNQPPPASVLIVDDRVDNLLTMEAVLSSLGADVLCADSGEEALRVLLRHDVAVIMLDVHMPGMDGFHTADLIRQRRATKTIPIIFMTAFGDEHMERGYEAGAVDYITKPYELEAMRAKVAVSLELHTKNLLLAKQAAQLRHLEDLLRSANASDATPVVTVAPGSGAMRQVADPAPGNVT